MSLKIGKHVVEYPLIQGGMGVRVSASGLAGAVARSGGVGLIACAGIGLNSSHYNGRNYFSADPLACEDYEKKWKIGDTSDRFLSSMVFYILRTEETNSFIATWKKL